MEPERAREWLMGPVVAVATPFKEDYSLDLDALQENVRYMIDNGVRTGQGGPACCRRRRRAPHFQPGRAQGLDGCGPRSGAGRGPRSRQHPAHRRQGNRGPGAARLQGRAAGSSAGANLLLHANRGRRTASVPDGGQGVGSVCYHPLFLFNHFGDCEGAMLRPGNVHSAERWREALEPVVERYQEKGVRLLFRADAAFAKPEVYEYLESRDIGYAMRLPANEVLQRHIRHLLKLHRGYVNRCVNDIRRRPSQPLIQWRFHPHTVHRGRRLRSTQGPSDA